MESDEDVRLACFTPDSRKSLLDALLTRNFNKFEKLLSSNPDKIDIPYGEPHFGTLLDICCLEPGRSPFIQSLLVHGANPNLINSVRKKAPIHLITISGDGEGLKALLNSDNTDVNLIDNTGSSALHYAAQSGSENMISLLLERSGIDINLINRKGKTPLHLALANENKNVVSLLLKENSIDLSITDLDDKSLRELIYETYPDLESLMQPKSPKKENSLDVTEQILFTHLKNHNFSKFIELAGGQGELLENNDGSFTFLQYCCEFGIEEVAEQLLLWGVSPNTTHGGNLSTPIMIASFKGFVKIVQMLINDETTNYSPVNNETALHFLINGAEMCNRALGDLDAEKDHNRCLRILLESVPRWKLDINQRDNKGNTVLHYAAKHDQKMAQMLLQAGAYIGVLNRAGEPACADINVKTMEKHLDASITTNNIQPRLEAFEIILDYSCLIPRNSLSGGAKENQIQVESDREEHSSKLMSNCESEPLLYISRSNELRQLLKHPIFTSYLHMKWNKIRPWFYANLSFYLLFWAFLTVYILTVYNSDGESGSDTTEQPIEETLSTSNPPSDEIISDRSDSFLWFPVLFFLLLLSIRELFQFLISPSRYVMNLENWLEIGIILVTGVILSGKTGVVLTHQTSAAGILLSWAELVLLVGKHPSLSTNIEMLKTVSWNFLKFLAWYSILIVAFALSFYSLFSHTDEALFVSPIVSIFKTIVMLTGEFDSGDIPFDQYPVTGRVLFVLFVFLIAIVLFNLLNGLAVSDTQAIKSDAELVGYISRIKLIAYIEKLLSNPINCLLLPVIQNLRCCLPNSIVQQKSDNCLDKINLFQEIADGKIRILPNYGNRVNLVPDGMRKKRHNSYHDPTCFTECRSIYMDPRIVRSARDILNNQADEREKAMERKILEIKEMELDKLIREVREMLIDIKKTYKG